MKCKKIFAATLSALLLFGCQTNSVSKENSKETLETLKQNVKTPETVSEFSLVVSLKQNGDEVKMRYNFLFDEKAQICQLKIIGEKGVTQNPQTIPTVDMYVDLASNEVYVQTPTESHLKLDDVNNGQMGQQLNNLLDMLKSKEYQSKQKQEVDFLLQQTTNQKFSVSDDGYQVSGSVKAEDFQKHISANHVNSMMPTAQLDASALIDYVVDVSKDNDIKKVTYKVEMTDPKMSIEISNENINTNPLKLEIPQNLLNLPLEK